MSTIYEKLRYLFDTKKLIKESIEQKGVHIDDAAPFRTYADKILKINDTVTPPEEEGGTNAQGMKVKTLSVMPTGNEFVIAASDENVDGFSAVTIRGDMNLIPENIRKGTKIYGVYGDYYPTLMDDKVLKPLSIEPGRDGKVHFPKDYAADGFSTITVLGDSDLLPENIKKDVTIFDVKGTYEGSGGGGDVGGIKYAQLSKITAAIAVTSLNNEDVEENQLSKINGTLSVTSVEPQEMTLN